MSDGSALLSLDMAVSRTSSAVSAEIDGQMVALDINKGVCYGLNEVATRIWQIIETPSSTREIADILIEEYEVDRDMCEAHVRDLLADLLAADLAQ